MNDELKPVRCGCGGEAKVIMIIEDVYAVECSKCWIRTGGYARTEAEAITAWNRAMGTEWRRLGNRESNLYCESCGAFAHAHAHYCHGCGARLEWE